MQEKECKYIRGCMLCSVSKLSNGKVVHLLRGYCGKHPKIWDGYLSYIQHAYNQFIHSSTNKLPFETIFGYFPKLPFDLVFASSSNGDSVLHNEGEQEKNFIERIKVIHKKIKE